MEKLYQNDGSILQLHKGYTLVIYSDEASNKHMHSNGNMVFVMCLCIFVKRIYNWISQGNKNISLKRNLSRFIGFKKC